MRIIYSLTRLFSIERARTRSQTFGLRLNEALTLRLNAYTMSSMTRLEIDQPQCL